MNPRPLLGQKEVVVDFFYYLVQILLGKGPLEIVTEDDFKAALESMSRFLVYGFAMVYFGEPYLVMCGRGLSLRTDFVRIMLERRQEVADWVQAQKK